VSEYEDKRIKCIDCQVDFTWTAGEQEYYKQKELFPPKRCTKCRLLRRQRVQGNVSVTKGDDF